MFIYAVHVTHQSHLHGRAMRQQLTTTASRCAYLRLMRITDAVARCTHMNRESVRAQHQRTGCSINIYKLVRARARALAAIAARDYLS